MRANCIKLQVPATSSSAPGYKFCLPQHRTTVFMLADQSSAWHSGGRARVNGGGSRRLPTAGAVRGAGAALRGRARQAWQQEQPVPSHGGRGHGARNQMGASSCGHPYRPLGEGEASGGPPRKRDLHGCRVPVITGSRDCCYHGHVRGSVRISGATLTQAVLQITSLQFCA